MVAMTLVPSCSITHVSESRSAPVATGVRDCSIAKACCPALVTPLTAPVAIRLTRLETSDALKLAFAESLMLAPAAQECRRLQGWPPAAFSRFARCDLRQATTIHGDRCLRAIQRRRARPR